jgi:hypothetical protein
LETIMTTTETKAPKSRTITLTNRPPVTVREDLWPVLASARDDSWTGLDPSRYMQSKQRGELDEYFVTVRQHEDGRSIVYAVLSAARSWTGNESRAEGAMLAAGADVARSIREVGERCGLPDKVIRDCIADLPAEDLDVAPPVTESNEVDLDSLPVDMSRWT